MKANSKGAKRRRRQKRSPDFIALASGHVQVVQGNADNPFAYGPGNPQQKVTVLKNRRSSPCTEYRNRGLIHDYQEQAAKTFEATYARSRSTAQAMDPTNEPVDGGGSGGGMTDGTIDAIKDMMGLHKCAGAAAYQLLEQVCGHGVYVNDLARNTNERGKLMRQLRDALDCAAIYWGYMKPRRHAS